MLVNQLAVKYSVRILDTMNHVKMIAYKQPTDLYQWTQFLVKGLKE